MVSRLLSSLSELLIPSTNDPKETQQQDDDNNDNTLKYSTTKVKKIKKNQPSSNTKKSEYGLQFINAESLDRAIVNRLQSRTNTSVADALEQKNSTSRVKLRCCEENIPRASSNLFRIENSGVRSRKYTDGTQSCEENIPRVASNLFQIENIGVRSRKYSDGTQSCEENIPRVASSLFRIENIGVRSGKYTDGTQSGDTKSAKRRQRKSMHVAETAHAVISSALTESEPGTETVFKTTTFTEHPRSRPQSAPSLSKESLSQSSIMSQTIPAVHSLATHSFKHSIGDTNAGDLPSEYLAQESQFPEDKRGIMYRNSQFNLENSSREALCSNSSKLHLNTNIQSQSDTKLQFPMFGIPDASLANQRPSVSFSTEAIHGSDISRSARELAEYNTAKRIPRPRSMSPSIRHSYMTPQISEEQIGDHLLDSTINDIIERGGDDFKSKYSSWIWDAFRSQLVKWKSRMIAEFNEKIKSSLEEREHEVSELQKRYRQKLSEFDSTTENFQQLMDNAYRDNQRMLQAKDFVIDKLKKEFLECKKHFEQDLQRQMHGYRAETEMERMELQKRNDELMLIMLTDHSKCGLEQAFKNEVQSLHQLIKRLTAQNEELHQQLEEVTNSASVLNKSAVDYLESQLDQATSEITELRTKLYCAEREKEDLTVTYNQDIAKLNRKIQESNTRYDHQLRDAAVELEIHRKKHARNIKDLKQRMANQEIQHTATINEIRQMYGGQVESLSQAVSQLRDQLTGGGGKH